MVESGIAHRSRRVAAVVLLAAMIVPARALTARAERQSQETPVAAGRTAGVLLPANLDPGDFRSALEKMWRGSETFRRQCDRLRAAPQLRVTIQRDLRRSDSYRAQTRFIRKSGVIIQAFVAISTIDAVVEVLAHEIEHVIEQLDAVDLERDTSPYVSKSEEAFETRRAIVIGRTVADEVARARKRPDWSSRSRP